MAAVRGVTLANPLPCRWCGSAAASSPCPWSVECPTCAAPAGFPCKRVDGHQTFTHLERAVTSSHQDTSVSQLPDQPPLFNADNPAQEALSV